MITVTDLITMDLTSLTAVELRKLGGELKVKGASKGKRADLLAAIGEIQNAQRELVEADLAEKYEDVLEAERNFKAEQDKLAKGASQYDDSDEAKKARRSRRGMVIVAKGNEIHKSTTFKEYAEARGFKVEITVGSMLVEEDDEVYEVETYEATATKAGYVVTGSWIGRAWNYPNAGAGVGGHARKVRNLKEALRLLDGQG